MDAFRRLAQVAGDGPVVANDYLRVSDHQGGRSASTQEQHEANLRTCEEHGWRAGWSYEDKVSASRYGRKEREDFTDLLADLEHGRFDAHVLMLWESSRGTRKVGEMVTLIELCEAREKFIWVDNHGRLYDPSNWRDRKTLLEDAIKNESDSAETSDRVTRTLSHTARQGRPHGRAGFGFAREYDPKTGRLVRQVLVAEEAKLGAELYERLYAGESLRSVTRDWNKRGIRTRTGKVWTAQHLRGFALCPSNAGLRGHGAGRKGGTTPALGADQLHKAQWPGFVSEDLWRAVNTMLRAEDRKHFRPGRGKHLLSTIGRCGVCGGPLSVAYRKNAEYQCPQGGCVRINKADLDGLVEPMLLEWLAQDSVITQLRAKTQTSDEVLAALRAELEEVRAQHEDLSRSVRERKVSLQFAEATEPGLLKDMQRLRRQIKEREVPSPLGCLIEPGEEVAVRWAKAPMSAKRAAVRALLCPQWFGELRVMRTERRGRNRVPAVERVRFFRRMRSAPPPAAAA